MIQGNFGARIWTGKNIWTFMCAAQYIYIYINVCIIRTVRLYETSDLTTQEYCNIHIIRSRRSSTNGLGGD